jgi:hypothetical protein
MKTAILKTACVSCIMLVILLYAISDLRAQSSGNIKLNENAFTFAARLIKEGHFVADGKGAWREHQPSIKVENEFIRLNGFSEYAKWHLAIDGRFAENTKRRYKFPYGDFRNIHRCALLAAKTRARQYGYIEIEHAAAELERAIKDKPLMKTDFHRLKSRLYKSVALTLPGR